VTAQATQTLEDPYAILDRLLRRVVAPTIAALLLSGVSGPHAAAQGDGVYFDDPASPAGKEYAIPLERARRQGQDSDRENSSRPAPRFGAGVTPPGDADGSDPPTGIAGSAGSGGPGGGADGRSGRGGGGADRDARSQRDSQTGSSGRSLEGAANTAARGSGSGGLSPELGLSGLAIAVVLAGLLLGVVVRRLRRQQGT
jgi:hypothetical protein